MTRPDKMFAKRVHTNLLVLLRKPYLAKQNIKALPIMGAPNAFRKQGTDVKDVDFTLGHFDIFGLRHRIRHH